MRAVHADLFRRVTGVDGPALLLDTPYGFQENAEEITARTTQYFRTNVGHPIEVAHWPGATDGTGGDRLAVERALDRIRGARMVFAGPGSPTYALRQWRGSGLSEALRDVLRNGGCVTFASAAALTLGIATVPVYEIYKAGLPPHWEEGLGVLDVTGLGAAVIPHYDNAEGGTHDTRFCYLGERRLRLLEPDLPSGAVVLGVDEHTACIFDLDDGTAEIAGRGVVTVRRDGRPRTFPAGQRVAIADLLAATRDDGLAGAATGAAGRATHGADAGGSRHHRAGSGVGDADRSDGDTSEGDPSEGDPLVDAAQRLDRRNREAVAARDVDGTVSSILELEQTIEDWSADTLTGDQRDRARSLLRGMIVRLGDVATVGAADPRERVAPFVEAVLRARGDVRAERAFALADRLRDALVDAGVEVQDTPDGARWILSEGI